MILTILSAVKVVLGAAGDKQRSKKMTYKEFLEKKVIIAMESGFEVSENEINSNLKPHQKDAVRWAIKGGCRALFESFGMGKTVQELEFARLTTEHDGGKALIVLPLGVKQEFERDAVNLLSMKKPVYVRTAAEVAACDAKIMLTNYERVRDGDIDPAVFTTVCLDEAAVLRGYGTKTYQTFLPKFRSVKYKLVATATPDPNRYKEIIHYAGFLGVMDTGQALTRFFQRDSTKANNLTLYPHKEEEFWLWVSSWALFLQSPADLGYDATGYDLPPMDIRYHKISTENVIATDRDGQTRIVFDASEGLTAEAREKRDSIPARIEKMKQIVDSAPDEHFILWHDLEAERHSIKKALPESVEVYGSQDIDEKKNAA